MTSLSQVKHLLVDLDGTLLGARNVPLQIEFIARSLRALRKYGGWWTAFRSLVAIKKELAQAPSEVIEEITNDKRAADAFARSLGLPIDEGTQILQEVMSNLFPLLKRHFFPVEAARDFLEWAKNHYPLTLATNPVWSEDIVRLRVEWAGINPDYFSQITHARIMHSCKPTPEYYREVLALHRLEPHQALLVGNEFKMDLPAIRVGIPVFIVAPAQAKRSQLPKRINTPKNSAPAWVGSFGQLRSMLTDSLGK